MAQKIDVAMPPALDIGGGYTIRVTGIDATSGALVAGVKVDTMTLYGDSIGMPITVETLPRGWALVPGPGA